MAQIEDLDDVLVGQERGELRFVDEHRNEFGILGQVGKDALDRHHLFKTLQAGLLGHEKFGHSARTDLVDQEIFSVMDRRIHLANTIS